MVLQILPNAGQMVHNRNAKVLEKRSRTDAGQLQQLRRLQSARGENHLTRRAHGVPHTIASVIDAYCTATVEHNTARVRASGHDQISTLPGWL